MIKLVAFVLMSVGAVVSAADKSPIRGSAVGRTSNYGHETQYYKSNGGYNGRATTSGNQTSYYDSKGSYAGRAVTSGNTTRYYDSKGRAAK